MEAGVLVVAVVHVEGGILALGALPGEAHGCNGNTELGRDLPVGIGDLGHRDPPEPLVVPGHEQHRVGAAVPDGLVKEASVGVEGRDARLGDVFLQDDGVYIDNSFIFKAKDINVQKLEERMLNAGQKEYFKANGEIKIDNDLLADELTRPADLAFEQSDAFQTVENNAIVTDRLNSFKKRYYRIDIIVGKIVIRKYAGLFTDEDQLMLVTDTGRVIRIPAGQISTYGRSSQGVRLMKLDDGEQIVDIAKLEDSDEEDEEGVEEGSEEIADETASDVGEDTAEAPTEVEE